MDVEADETLFGGQSDRGFCDCCFSNIGAAFGRQLHVENVESQACC